MNWSSLPLFRIPQFFVIGLKAKTSSSFPFAMDVDPLWSSITALLSSELGERFNGTVRRAICETNRQHASRDVATQFAQRAVIRDKVHGSYYFGQSPYMNLLALGDNPTFRSKVFGEQLRKRWKIRNGVVFASTTGHRLGVITGFGRDGYILVAPLKFLKSDLVFDTYRQSVSSTLLQETELLGQFDLIPGQSKSFK
jgi:hypothetical protein